MRAVNPVDLVANVSDLAWSDIDPKRTLAPDRARAAAFAVDVLMATPRVDRWRDAVAPAVTRAFAHARALGVALAPPFARERA